MTSSLPGRSWSAMLLASACVLTAGSLPQPARAASGPPAAAQDLGPLDDDTSITATVWLRQRDEAGFEDAVARRMTPGSALYHRWMTAAEVAAWSPAGEDVDRLAASMRAAGLQVVDRQGDNSSLTVRGTAARMGLAFGTQFHVLSASGRRFYANISEPRFTGAAAGLITGVTGLTNVPATPFVRRQIDLATGRVAGTLSAGVNNPFTVFTDQCFKARVTDTIGGFVPSGGRGSATYAGPEYTTRNLPGVGYKTCGYTPGQIAAHYGLPAVYAHGWTGKGQTIVIVDAYGSPTIQSDANTFSAMMGLPKLTAANFRTFYYYVTPIASPYTTDWPLEISLDVEWAHAVAPDAKIVLVVAPSDDFTELAYAVQYAVRNQLGDVISNSYGSPEVSHGPAVARSFNAVIRKAAAEGIAVNVSSGDDGDFGLGTPVGAASIPADSPYATAVGGTSLNVPSDNGPVDSAWGIALTGLGDQNDLAVPPGIEGFQQGSGGGQSLYLGKPRWQKALPGVGRQLPDISAVADPQTGGIVVADVGDGSGATLLTVGGTSLSSPIFSGIWALAQQAAGERLGQAGPIIAAMPSAALNDILPIPATASNLSGAITVGTTVTPYDASDLLGLTATQPNGFVGVLAVVGEDSTVDLGFGADSSLMAAPGWDTATGFGEPNGLAFIKAARQAASAP